MIHTDQALRARRARRPRRPRRARGFRKPRRPQRQAFPDQAEREYIRALTGIAQEAIDLVGEIVIPELTRIERLAIPTSDNRADAIPWIGILARLFRKVESRMAEHIEPRFLRRLSGETAGKISAANKAAMTKQLRASVGVDIFLADPSLAETVAGFTTENVALIKTIPERMFGKVEGVINQGFKKGQRSEQLMGQISNQFGVSRRRARFIARDQTSKLNGQLTMERQSELGINGYIWRTSLDERVRESHRNLEGSRHKWSAPPAVGHPGEDYNCRCHAEPIIPGVAAIKTSPRNVPRDPELVKAFRKRERRRQI